MGYSIARTQFDWQDGEPDEDKPLPILSSESGGELNPYGDWHKGEDDEEWEGAEAESPVAYVRGATPRFSAWFESTIGESAEIKLRARNLDDVGEIHVKVTVAKLTFKRSEEEEGKAVSAPVRFELSGALPSTVGVTRLRLQWEFRRDGEDKWEKAGRSTHLLLTTWNTPFDLDLGALGPWNFDRFVLYGCEAAAGLGADHGEKDVCDALIARLSALGPSYNFVNNEPSLLEFLRQGTGACRLWSAAFRAIAAWQGIALEGRALYLQRRDGEDEQRLWEALVAMAPGVGNAQVIEEPNTFFDAVSPFPIDGSAELLKLITRRYRFWFGDGHAIAFLETEQGVCLYDPSFLTYGVDIPMTIPALGESTGEPLTVFRAYYFDHAFPFLMGQLVYDGKLYKAEPPGSNGITVATSKVPSELVSIRWEKA